MYSLIDKLFLELCFNIMDRLNEKTLKYESTRCSDLVPAISLVGSAGGILTIGAAPPEGGGGGGGAWTGASMAWA